jgi:hypothetical protein
VAIRALSASETASTRATGFMAGKGNGGRGTVIRRAKVGLGSLVDGGKCGGPRITRKRANIKRCLRRHSVPGGLKMSYGEVPTKHTKHTKAERRSDRIQGLGAEEREPFDSTGAEQAH